MSVTRKLTLNNENLHLRLQEGIYHIRGSFMGHAVDIVRLLHYIDPSVFHSTRYRVACSIELGHLDVLTRWPWTNLSCAGQTLSFYRYRHVNGAKPVGSEGRQPFHDKFMESRRRSPEVDRWNGPEASTTFQNRYRLIPFIVELNIYIPALFRFSFFFFNTKRSF